MFEALRCGCAVLVIINQSLQGNHQTDLAFELHDLGAVEYTIPEHLVGVMRNHQLRIPLTTPAERASGVGIGCATGCGKDGDDVREAGDDSIDDDDAAATAGRSECLHAVLCNGVVVMTGLVGAVIL